MAVVYEAAAAGAGVLGGGVCPAAVTLGTTGGPCGFGAGLLGPYGLGAGWSVLVGVGPLGVLGARVGEGKWGDLRALLRCPLP